MLVSYLLTSPDFVVKKLSAFCSWNLYWFYWSNYVSPSPLENVTTCLSSESHGPDCLIKSVWIWCVLGKEYTMKLLSKLNVRWIWLLCHVFLCSGLTPKTEFDGSLHHAGHVYLMANLYKLFWSRGCHVRSHLAHSRIGIFW